MKFKVSYDIDFTLIGIRSEIKDYQFAYFLNCSSFFLFNRMDKDISYMINGKKIYFSAFEHLNAELKKTSFLIKNQAVYSASFDHFPNLFTEKSIHNTSFLIPELKDFDYLVKLVGIWKNQELKDLKKFLINLDAVEAQATIDGARLKSINNLIF